MRDLNTRVQCPLPAKNHSSSKNTDYENVYSAQSAGEPADGVPGAAWGGRLCALAFALRVHSHEQEETAEHVAALRPVHSTRRRGSLVWDDQHCCSSLAEVHIIDWETTNVRARAIGDLW